VIRTLGRVLSRFAGRWVPDPFAIALLLTLFTIGLAMLAQGQGLTDTVGQWGGRLQHGELLSKEKGLWKLLAFGMQMCLILVTGHALASSPPIRRVIDRLAARPQTASQAIALTAVVAMMCAFVNWGLGLIVGALMAREVGLSTRARGVKVHYPLLGAAGYGGLLVWHGGLSGSAPLTVTQAKDITAILGPDIAPIPLGETIFSPLNLAVTLALLVLVPLVLVRMMPDADDIVEVDPETLGATSGSAPPVDSPKTPADRLDRSLALVCATTALAGLYLYQYVGRIGLDRVDLNAINLAFLGLGLVLHGSARAYSDAITDATRGCSGIILQFPIYAGIMGIMAMSGLVDAIAQWIAGMASADSLGPLTFLSAGVVNLFVPSGGGQWAIQGPVVLQAADALHVPHGQGRHGVLLR
jgi:short-chain fatty acids transporter